MMRQILACLALVAGASFPGSAGAFMTPLDPGLPPGAMDGGQVTLPGGQDVDVLTREQCERQRSGQESCPTGFDFFVRTTAPLPVGINVSYSVVTSGQTRSGSATVGPNGQLVGTLTAGAGGVATPRAGRRSLETITVQTKQARAQDIQTMPTAVTGFSGITLERQQAVTLEDFNHSIPNVQLEHVGLFQAAASFSMRGIGTAGIESQADPVVAVFVDGAYYSRNAVALLDLFDVESIQALRGPQGTVYGRNAFAGAIVVQTKRPVMDEYQASFEMDVGNAGRVNVGIVGNMPVVKDKVAFRIAANYHKLNGFFKNSGEVVESFDPGDILLGGSTPGTLVTRVDEDLKGTRHNGEKSVYLRPSIRITPNDRLDISIVGEVRRDRGDGTANWSQCYQPNSFPPPLGNGPSGVPDLHTLLGFPCKEPFGDPRFGIEPDGSDPFVADFNLRPDQTNHNVWGILVDASYETDFGTFSLMFSHRDVEEDVTTDTDGFNFDVFSSTRLQWFHATQFELRYNTTIADRIDVLAGVFFLQDFYEVNQFLWIFADSGLFGGGGFTRDNPFVSWGRNGQDRRTWAGYVQIDWHFTDQLTLTLGGRYSWEKKFNIVGMAINDSNCPPGTVPRPVADADPSGVLVGAPCNGVPFAGNDPTDVTDFNPAVSFGPIQDTWDAFSPRVGLDYELNDDVLVFGFWQRAYKSGGFVNNAGSLEVFSDPFDQERVDNFEIGLKSDWFDDRLRINLNAFHARYANLQRNVIRAADTSTGQETFTDNAAGAKSWGVELEFSAILIEGLTFYGNVGWLDIQYRDFVADINGDGIATDNSALELVRAPTWDLRVGLDYEFAIGNMGLITVGVGLSHTTRLFLTVPNDVGFIRNPLTTVDAQVNWESPTGRYRVSVWGRNLNNDVERLGGTPVGSLFAFNAPTQPREYGVAVKAAF